MVLSATGSLGTSWDLTNSLAIDPESLWQSGEEATERETRVPQDSDDARDEMCHVLHFQDGVHHSTGSNLTALKKVKAEIPITEKPAADDSPAQVAELTVFEFGAIVCASFSVAALVSLLVNWEDMKFTLQNTASGFLAREFVEKSSFEELGFQERMHRFTRSFPLGLRTVLEVETAKAKELNFVRALFNDVVKFVGTDRVTIYHDAADNVAGIRFLNSDCRQVIPLNLLRRLIQKGCRFSGFAESATNLVLTKLQGKTPYEQMEKDRVEAFDLLLTLCLEISAGQGLSDDTFKEVLKNPNTSYVSKLQAVRSLCDREDPISSDLFDAILDADWSYIPDYAGWGTDVIHVGSSLTAILGLLTRPIIRENKIIKKNNMDWDAITKWYGKKDRVLLSGEWAGIYLLINEAPDLSRVDTLFSALFDRVPPDVQLGMLAAYKEKASVERCRILLEGFLTSGCITLAHLNHSVKMAVSEILFCNGSLKRRVYPSCGHSPSTGFNWRAIYDFLWSGDDVEKLAEAAIKKQAERIAMGEVRDRHELSFFVKVLLPYAWGASLEGAFRWILSHPKEIAHDDDILATALDGLIFAFKEKRFAPRIPFDFVPAFCDYLGALGHSESGDKLKAAFSSYLVAHFQYHGNVPLPPQLKRQLDLLGIVYG